MLHQRILDVNFVLGLVQAKHFGKVRLVRDSRKGLCRIVHVEWFMYQRNRSTNNVGSAGRGTEETIESN